MQDHERPIIKSLDSALATIRGEDIEPDEREDWTPFDDVLSVERKVVTDVVMGLGGPTRYFRVWSDTQGEVWRVEWHDSWGVPNMVRLTDGEAREVLDAFGWDDLELWQEGY